MPQIHTTTMSVPPDTIWYDPITIFIKFDHLKINVSRIFLSIYWVVICTQFIMISKWNYGLFSCSRCSEKGCLFKCNIGCIMCLRFSILFEYMKLDRKHRRSRETEADWSTPLSMSSICKTTWLMEQTSLSKRPLHWRMQFFLKNSDGKVRVWRKVWNYNRDCLQDVDHYQAWSNWEHWYAVVFLSISSFILPNWEHCIRMMMNLITPSITPQQK